MKISNIFRFFAVAAIVGTLAACSDDDDAKVR